MSTGLRCALCRDAVEREVIGDAIDAAGFGTIRLTIPTPAAAHFPRNSMTSAIVALGFSSITQ